MADEMTLLERSRFVRACVDRTPHAHVRRHSPSSFLGTVRTGYAHQPSACRIYLGRRAACLCGGTHRAYAVRVPASGVPYATIR